MARTTAILLVLAVWHWGLAAFGSLVVPTIGSVAKAVWHLAEDGVVVEAFGVSLARLAVGFVVTVILGVVVGVAVGRFRLVEVALHDFVVIGVTWPYLITALLVAIWLGFDGIGPTLVMVTAGVPFVILNTAAGVKSVDKRLVDMARSYGVPERRILRHVILPTTFPFLFAAMRLTFSVGWRALIMAEVFAATVGAGNKISHYWSTSQEEMVVAMGLYFAVFALIMERIFVMMSNRAFRWRVSSVGSTAPQVP